MSRAQAADIENWQICNLKIPDRRMPRRAEYAVIVTASWIIGNCPAGLLSNGTRWMTVTPTAAG